MRYTNIGDEVTVPATLVQATIALDSAGKMAYDQKNIESMLQVAKSWMDFAGLMIAVEENEDKRSEPKKKVKLGFQPTSPEDEEDIELEDEDARSDED